MGSFSFRHVSNFGRMRKQYESMMTPLAYYQAVDEGLVALLVTDGLCAMMGRSGRS